MAVVLVPQLGGHEDLLARDAAAGDGPAHALLVAVDHGGVDVPVAGRQGLAHHVLGDVGVDLPDAVAELRDGAAVVQGQGRGEGHRCCLSWGAAAAEAAAGVTVESEVKDASPL